MGWVCIYRCNTSITRRSAIRQRYSHSQPFLLLSDRWEKGVVTLETHFYDEKNKTLIYFTRLNPDKYVSNYTYCDMNRTYWLIRHQCEMRILSDNNTQIVDLKVMTSVNMYCVPKRTGLLFIIRTYALFIISGSFDLDVMIDNHLWIWNAMISVECC